MQLDLAIPDYTSLCKRAAKLGIAILLTKKKGKIDIVVDSTGLKVFGEGEWKVKKHGWAKHRTWRKLHLAIDPETQEIVADDLTDNATDDAAEVPPIKKRNRKYDVKYSTTSQTSECHCIFSKINSQQCRCELRFSPSEIKANVFMRISGLNGNCPNRTYQLRWRRLKTRKHSVVTEAFEPGNCMLKIKRSQYSLMVLVAALFFGGKRGDAGVRQT